MKKKTNFSNILKEIEPLRKDNAGTMTGGFAPFGGQNQLQQQVSFLILNSVLVGVLGYACSCNCECSC